jgi:hypothetical protein
LDSIAKDKDLAVTLSQRIEHRLNATSILFTAIVPRRASAAGREAVKQSVGPVRCVRFREALEANAACGYLNMAPVCQGQPLGGETSEPVVKWELALLGVLDQLAIAIPCALVRRPSIINHAAR